MMGIPFEEDHDDYGETRYFKKGANVIAVYQRGWNSTAETPIMSVRSLGNPNPDAVNEFVKLIMV